MAEGRIKADCNAFAEQIGYFDGAACVHCLHLRLLISLAILMPGSGNLHALFGTDWQKEVGLQDATLSQVSVDGWIGLGGSGPGEGPGEGPGVGPGPGGGLGEGLA